MKLLKKLFGKQENSSKECDVDSGAAIRRPSYDILTNYIRDVFYEKSYAEYVAGTLTFKVNYAGIGPESEELIFCNFNETEAPEDYLFWLAMCYLKYKSPTTHHYPTALGIVKNYHDQVLAAKLLLEVI